MKALLYISSFSPHQSVPDFLHLINMHLKKNLKPSQKSLNAYEYHKLVGELKVSSFRDNRRLHSKSFLMKVQKHFIWFLFISSKTHTDQRIDALFVLFFSKKTNKKKTCIYLWQIRRNVLRIKDTTLVGVWFQASLALIIIRNQNPHWWQSVATNRNEIYKSACHFNKLLYSVCQNI